MKMTLPVARSMVRKIKNKEKVDNETLFFVLRFYENRFKTTILWIEKREGFKGVKLLKDQIVQQNRGLMFKYLQKYNSQWSNISADDLISEIQLAIVRAIKCFDPHRGIRWSTYVCNVIQKAIWRLYSKNKKREVLLSPRQDYHTMLWEIPTEKKEKPHPDVDILNEVLVSNEADLNQREFEIIHLRRVQKLSSLGKQYSVSKEAIRQVDKKALRKLREAIQRRKLMEAKK